MKKSPPKKSEYLDDLKQWGEKQYLPGAYLGGNLPPYIKYSNKLFGFLLAAMGLFVVASFFFVFIEQIKSTGLSSVGLIEYSILLEGSIVLAAGIAIIRKK